MLIDQNELLLFYCLSKGILSQQKKTDNEILQSIYFAY